MNFSPLILNHKRSGFKLLNFRLFLYMKKLLKAFLRACQEPGRFKISSFNERFAHSALTKTLKDRYLGFLKEAVLNSLEPSGFLL
jgi:hypothetical protein